MKQFLITPAAGKRLIAKALAIHPAISGCLRDGTLAIIAGTTSGYCAEEILKNQGIRGFSKKHFFRGIILPPSKKVTVEGRLPDESKFPGDVIIAKGVWQKGKTIADVVDSLKEGDVIIKGANALDLTHKRAAILIGHPKAGTAGLTLPAIVGRRVKLIVAVGLEKRVNGDIFALAQRLNSPGAKGYRMLPVPGEVFTEIEALKLMAGVDAELVSSGGVGGAEGSCLLAISGTNEQEELAEKVYASVANEPAFELS